MMEVNINYLAVFVAAVASFAIGFVWYGPLFGKQWMKLAGITKASMKSMNLSPKKAMSIGFVVTLLTAYVLTHFVQYLEVTTWAAAAQFAFWIWLGLVMPVQIGAFLWEGKSFKLFVLNTAHNLVTLIVMSGILAVWR